MIASRTWLPVDAFYEPPADVPAEPGVLLRSESLADRLLPKGARAWRILYTTTFADDAPAVGVATVLAPTDPPPGPRPVITWEHGTVGILQKCMPSLVSAPFEGVPALDQVVAEGWVLVAADYAPNEHGVHPYIIGEGEARSALDAVRAAKQMPELTLSDQTVVWGHSQGGQAALWTGIVGARYAPDVNILGVAAIAPASNMEQILTLHGGDSSGARLGAFIATAYSQYYPDVIFDEVVSPTARDIARQIADLCQFDPQHIPTLQALTEQLGGTPVLADPAAGALGERLRENAPNAPIAVPLLIAQGLADIVIDPSVNDAYVAERCAAGQGLDYWHVPGRDHGGIVAPGSPIDDPLIQWTRDRFAGTPQTTGCQYETIA
jgi:alpha-beta hydrolase superfamily lysophospholipase